jgi:hypothetical protein
VPPGRLRLIDNRPHHQLWAQLEGVDQELVGMDRLDAVWSESGRREVTQVERDQRVRPTGDCGGQDVPVLEVGDHGGFEMVEVAHGRVREVRPHQVKRAVEPRRVDVPAFPQYGVAYLGKDAVAPQRPVQPRRRQAQQGVAKRVGKQDVGIQKGREEH